MRTSELSFEQLERALREGDVRAVIDAFAGRSENERRAVAPDVISAVREYVPEQARPKELALLACASLSELRALEGVVFSEFGDEEYEVLVERRPGWLQSWLVRQLERPHTLRGLRSPWPLCRRLIRSGLCSKPDTDAYILRMITGIGWHPDVERRQRPLREILLDDPELLEDEIWRLFEVEGERQGNNLTTVQDASWATTLAELAGDGTISRDRLLDSTLDALERDFSAYNARWFEAFHTTLDPTDDELAARAHRYLRLLDHRLPTTVALALDSLDALEREGAVGASELVAHVGAALNASPKKTAIAALGLLGRALERDVGARATGLAAATAALENRAVDVQRRALDLIDRFGDAVDGEVRGALLGCAAVVAPSLRARLDGLIGIDLTAGDDRQAPASTAQFWSRADRLPATVRALAGVDAALAAVRIGELPAALRFSVRDLPGVHRGKPLTPIEDHEELLELLTRLIECADSADDVERALDGVARLCGSEPPGFATAAKPLRKRALALASSTDATELGPFSWGDPRGDLYDIAVAWLAADEVARATSYRLGRLASRLAGAGAAARGPGGLLSVRALAVARAALAGEPRPLLSTPTHAGGWIDPAALQPRVAALEATGSAPLPDAVLAIMRLAPPAGDQPPPSLRAHSSELARALRTALGEPGLARGSSDALWTAAAAVRATADAGDRDSAGPAGSGGLFFKDPLGVLLTTDATAGDEHQRWERTYLSGRWGARADAIRWVATVWPACREPFYAAGRARQDKWRDAGAPMPDEGAFLEPLVDPDEPLLAEGTTALMSAIATRDPARRSIAIDVIIAAIADGRLDHDQLGRALTRTVADGRNRVRTAGALEAVAHASPLTAECVRLALEHSLAAQAPAPSRDAHAFLGVLNELAADAHAGVSDPSARAYLDGVGGRSKAATLAAELRALEPGPGRHLHAAAILALEGRLQRAERWDAEHPEPAG